jgi:hyaluronoglucosaminidase
VIAYLAIMSLLSPPPRRLVHHGAAVPLRPGDGVAITGATGATRAAEHVVRSALAALGVHRVGVPDPDLVVRFGHHPGVPGAYRVVTGPREVVLDGADEDGHFHAAQAFRQLAAAGLPAVTVEDAPAMAYRGSIEGFYGTPWTHRERLAHLDFLGAHRMNTYVYAPKDDPYHRDHWREPYPGEDLARLGELVRRARDNHVRLVFTVSPGLSIRYSEPAYLLALLDKFDAVRELGCDAFAVALDDIDHRTWHDPRDEARFGTPGAAHAWLVNETREWAEKAGVTTPVQLVPTEYHGLEDTRYKQDLRERLADDVHVWWTGHDVLPATITVEEARRARELFGRPLLVWDNYPVNDYIAGRVPLGPYDGRENGLSAHVEGVLSNPANQVAMSTVALRSFADYSWDDSGFDAAGSHERALAALAGGRPDTLAALTAFADLNTRDDRLHLEQAPRHAAALATVRADLAAGKRGAALARLTEVANRLIGAPRLIGHADPRFAVEAEAWLTAAGLWGQALGALLPVVEHGAGKDRVRELVALARAVRDDRLPHRTVGVLVGDGVLDTFVAEVLDAS